MRLKLCAPGITCLSRSCLMQGLLRLAVWCGEARTFTILAHSCTHEAVATTSFLCTTENSRSAAFTPPKPISSGVKRV